MTTRLPVLLDNIRIATPCTADWDEMAGSDKVRFCGQCEKNVYNLSAMTQTEAQSLVEKKDGRMCVRLYQRPDGTVLTADCPVGVRRARLRQRVWASLSGFAASVALLLGVAGGRARADLDVKTGNKTIPGHTRVAMGGPVAMPTKMGKMQAPKPPAPVMGEPAPIDRLPLPMMGDVAFEPSPQPTAQKK